MSAVAAARDVVRIAGVTVSKLPHFKILINHSLNGLFLVAYD